ncbi:MAG: IPT/TIG domain-containing protein [Acidobacteriota bacterium]
MNQGQTLAFRSRAVVAILWCLVVLLSGSGVLVGQSQEVTYTYDSLGRVTSVTYGDQAAVYYTYDAGGNRLAVQVESAGGIPLPAITSLTPNQVVAGAAGFTLTVRGSNFSTDAVVQWNGANRSTTFVSDSQLTAEISSADVQAPGTVPVTVLSGGEGGRVSNAVVFSVVDPTAPTISSLSFSPSSLAGGTTANALLVLNKPAPAGGAIIALSSSNAAAMVPTTVTIAEGSASAGFSVDTASVSVPTAVTISASYNGLSRTATLVILSEGNEPAFTNFVPIVLSSSGNNNSFFSSELILTNRSDRTAVLDFSYVSAFGGGDGSASDLLPAGVQRVLPDAISYLKSIGVPLPDSGNRGGTLTIRYSGPAAEADVGVTVRLTTAVAEGRAGLAFQGVSPAEGFTQPVYLCGLRQDAFDRSNVAVQHMGSAEDGEITLRLTVFSGSPEHPGFVTLADQVLSPGQFFQFSEILAADGLAATSGYVRVERVSGNAPFFAYGVINDQSNSDGSFVPAVLEAAQVGRSGMTIPVIVETSSFRSELVATNFSAAERTVRFAYVAQAISDPTSTARFSLTIKPGQQIIIPNLVQYLRDQAVPGVGPADQNYVGALFADVEVGDFTGLYIGVRTSTPGGGGQYGLFYSGVLSGSASTEQAWVYALKQDAETRSNLALVNTGETDSSPDAFTLEIVDGNTGLRVNSVEGFEVKAREWRQLGSVLAQYAPGTVQGYIRVIRTSGANPFIVYGVVNDGGQPGERSGDGAFVPGSR